MRALITGVSGQDGSYLAELLLSKGYEVYGLIRRSSSPNTWRIDHIYNEYDPACPLKLLTADLADTGSLIRALQQAEPDEVYNLAAQSHVNVSFQIPEYSEDVTALGPLRLLEAIRILGLPAKFYQASSSEMFGDSPAPQNEDTPLRPRSPYGAAKTYAYQMSKIYRESYGMFICNGILFNHESPRRGETFVTRKIAMAAAQISAGQQDKLYLGNLDARRDWGFAGDYVEAMWAMLQQETPGDYVVATGESRSIRDFLDAAFQFVDLDWTRYAESYPGHFRPSEVDHLCGDASKAKEVLGWEPKVRFKELAEMMVSAELSVPLVACG